MAETNSQKAIRVAREYAEQFPGHGVTATVNGQKIVIQERTIPVKPIEIPEKQ